MKKLSKYTIMYLEYTKKYESSLSLFLNDNAPKRYISKTRQKVKEDMQKLLELQAIRPTTTKRNGLMYELIDETFDLDGFTY